MYFQILGKGAFGKVVLVEKKDSSKNLKVYNDLDFRKTICHENTKKRLY